MLACGRESAPTCTSRTAESCSASTRRVADLPVPTPPVTRANPPSPTSCWTRQQKDSMRGVRCRASTGTSGENGFHLTPYRARSFLIIGGSL